VVPEVQTKKKKLSRKRILTVVAVVLIVVVVASVFTLLTIPRSVLDSHMYSLASGEVVNDTFRVPVFAGNVQVTVNMTMTSNLATWAANITNQDGAQVWTHQAEQDDPQLYTTEWFSLPAGTYTVTFTTVGEGVLSAFVKVSAKGAFW
jgi:hypothetical protein